MDIECATRMGYSRLFKGCEAQFTVRIVGLCGKLRMFALRRRHLRSASAVGGSPAAWQSALAALALASGSVGLQPARSL